jgi:hypothetical protein
MLADLTAAIGVQNGAKTNHAQVSTSIDLLTCRNKRGAGILKMLDLPLFALLVTSNKRPFAVSILQL